MSSCCNLHWSLSFSSVSIGSYPSPQQKSSLLFTGSTSSSTFYFTKSAGKHFANGASTLLDYKIAQTCTNPFTMRIQPALVEIDILDRPTLWKALLYSGGTNIVTYKNTIADKHPVTVSETLSLIRSDITRSRFQLSPIEAEASTLLLEKWMLNTYSEYKQELSIIAAVVISTVCNLTFEENSASDIADYALYTFSQLVETLILPSSSLILYQHLSSSRILSRETRRVSFAVEILSFWDSSLHIHLFNMGLEGELWVPQIA